jgi:hypothetical protein
MSHFAFDGVNTLSPAFDGTSAISSLRLKRVQTFALFLIVAGCCVVGAASLGAGAYQAEGASNFEQLALAIMVNSTLKFIPPFVTSACLSLDITHYERRRTRHPNKSASLKLQRRVSAR